MPNASPAGRRPDPNALSIAFSNRSLCTRSGTCIGVCPEDAISLDEHYYPVLDESLCTSCGKCAQVCPGGSVSFSKLADQVFGQTGNETGFDGRVLDTYVGYSTDDEIRSGGAGGGVITALLYDLLKHGDVTGCVVTRMCPEKPWLAEPFIATTKEDLVRSQGSRYTVVPLNRILRLIRTQPGPVAVAALPCHIHGLRQAMAHDPEIKNKLYGIVGLFCGGALEVNVVPELLSTKGIRKEEIADFQFRGGEWPGRMRAVLKSGEIRDLHYSNYKDGAYNYFIGLYMPGRCQLCIDGSGEFSDLSVSDAWTRDESGEYKFKGQSRIITRTQKGLSMLADAIRRKSIIATNLHNDTQYRTHKNQTRRKGLNAPLRVARYHASGKSSPVYDRQTPPASSRDRWVERGVSSLLWLGRYKCFRYPLIKFLTSRSAIPLITLRVWLKRRKYQRG